jgi:hypothetical protein
MRFRTGRGLQVLFAPSDAVARRLSALPEHALPLSGESRSEIIAGARAARADAAVTQAESELLRKRARRIGRASSRLLDDVGGSQQGRWAAA